MIKINDTSKIGVWGREYLNNADARFAEDNQCVNIIQVEATTDGLYLVEYIVSDVARCTVDCTDDPANGFLINAKDGITYPREKD